MKAFYDTALILSGGGTRLMIYLGMYAALEDLQMRPDVLIGTCGGAFAVTVINAFADNLARKEYLKSEEYYQFVIKERYTDERKLRNIGLFSLQKMLNKRNAPYIEDVINKYLIDLPQDLFKELPTLSSSEFSSQIPSLILGSHILFDPRDIGQKRRNRKLYQKVIFTDAHTAKSIDLERIAITSKDYKDSAISERPRIITNTPMLTCARVSVSDMFYVPPTKIADIYFAGGAIDLLPIELAKHIADTIVMEKKQAYSHLEEAFVRAVLGYSGNKRLEAIRSHSINYQIDTTHIKKDLDGHYLKKRIDWNKLEVCFDRPKNYQHFRKDMDLQWHYGYKQTIECIQKKCSLS